MESEMPRVITNKDPVNRSVTFKQGYRTIKVYLDPWPDTDEEIEAQANAKLPPYTGDDDSKVRAFYADQTEPTEEL
jgi:hypothetical protein